MLWYIPRNNFFFLGRRRVGQMGVARADDEIGEGSGEGAAVGPCGETAVGADEETTVETGGEAAIGALCLRLSST